jgi:hypothetical protein
MNLLTDLLLYATELIIVMGLVALGILWSVDD